MAQPTAIQQIPPLPLALLNAWAALHGEHWFFWTLHWRAKGSPQYADHLLYQRLYEARTPEIDRLAEVIAAIGGSSLLDPARALAASQPFVMSLDKLKVPDAHKALVAAQTVMLAFQEADTAAKGSPYQMAVNNALAGFADSHLEAVYLLQQRLNGRVMPMPATRSPYTPYNETTHALQSAATLGNPDENDASLFSMRQNSRAAKQNAVPQIMDQFGSLLGLVPGLAMGKSIGIGMALGGALYALLQLIKGSKK